MAEHGSGGEAADAAASGSVLCQMTHRRYFHGAQPADPDHLKIDHNPRKSQRYGEQFPYIPYAQNMVAMAPRTIVGRDIS
jgi:hypothetical protein